MPKLYGKVKDVLGNPLADSDIFIKNEKFEDLYSCKTNDQGEYSIEVEKGKYYTIGIFKDYRVRFLEYWAWNIIIDEDTKLDAEIDGIEIYCGNAFKIQGAYPSVNVFFRPMSLKRLKEIEEKEDMSKLEIIDIAPELLIDDIQASLNGENVDILMINKVKEFAGPGQSMYSYLVQISLNETFDNSENNLITLKVYDRKTKESGMGSILLDKNFSV